MELVKSYRGRSPVLGVLTYQKRGDYLCGLSYTYLAKGAKAVGFADPEHAPKTDITGQPRDKTPDADFYEYRKKQ